ncbi:MAG TPA: electron transfer flavoprotein subunit alpha/FixB family protein [Miltoncostaeaceae bacterium]|jgi:electron transfer flavoprotein alpha subunit|nr:electron transfer flavoprotein subunit alpha/FixB family protein [Miltoncostaeaceae bacterium]
MSTLVFLEHHGSAIQRGALGVLGKAAQLDPETAGVVVGSGVREAAAGAGRFGAKTVYVADDAALEAPLPQPRVDVISRLVAEKGFDTVLFAASVLSADVAGGVAARLGAGLNWDLGDLERDGGALVGKRSALGDTVMVDVGWTAEPRLGLIRAGSFDPAESGGEAAVEEISTDLEEFSSKAEMVEQAHEEQSGPSIEEADILVTGGRGLGAPEKFSIVEELAAALGGAVASTRAVVDSGWYPYATQVGQTGKVVSPKLYIGAGVSGAIQHKVGMQTSQTIVAINKDPNAPIFEFSDMGIVGDLNDVVPKLTELVKQRKA